MSRPMMSCGHAANATSEGQPSCVICAGIGPKPVPVEPPDLTGRTSRCTYCKREAPSSLGLAFFSYRGPGSRWESLPMYGKTEPRGPAEFDDHYCGCRGWD